MMNRAKPAHVPDQDWKNGPPDDPTPTDEQLEPIVCDMLDGMSGGEILNYGIMYDVIMAAMKPRALDIWFDKNAEPLVPDDDGDC